MSGELALVERDRTGRTVGSREKCSAAPERPLVLLSSLSPGGAERVAVSLVCRLAHRGHRPILCTLVSRDDAELAGELRRAGVARLDLAARRLSDGAAVLRYVNMLGRAGIDLVHAHGQDAWILSSLGRRLTSAPLVLTRHVLDEPANTWRQSLRRRCALRAVRCADAVVAPSPTTANCLAEQVGISASQIHVIPNGVDLERFQHASGTAVREALRRALGFAAGDRIALVPAVLRHGKGHEVLLDALPAIRRTVPSVRVLFAGGGDREAELRDRAAAHGASVVFLGHRSDMPGLMAAADLVVLPSYSEVLPMALIEAAAAARPVVATRVGGTADIVEHGTSGLLVPPGNPHALAAAIASVLADPVRARAFGQAGRVVAHRRFSLDAHVDRTLSLWSHVVETARRRTS